MKPANISRRRSEIQARWSAGERRLRAVIGRLRASQLLAMLADAQSEKLSGETRSPSPWRRARPELAAR